MKKGFVVVLVLTCMLLVSTAFAQRPALDVWNSYTLTRDWGTSTSEWARPRQIYNIGYNEVAAAIDDNLYINDGNNIRIANRNDGVLRDTDFPTASSYDRLTSWTAGLGADFYFSVGVADDQAIYATDLGRGLILYRWANAAASPTSQTVAGMNFTRQLVAKGAGVNTEILVTGNADDGQVQILTTGDGTTFAVADTIDYAGKTAIAFKDSTTIFGSGPWNTSPAGDVTSGGHPMRFDKSGGVWTRGFFAAPPNKFEAPDNGYGFSYDLGHGWLQVDSSDPAYPTGGLLWTNKYYPWPDEMWLLNDRTGYGEAKISLGDMEGVPTWGAHYYGAAAADSAERKVYWGVRASYNTSRGFYGRYSVVYQGSGVSDWELY
jgi:hypothetical protein